ncbi:MAG: cytochrome c [Proteobacteria bacterium]|nr:cytochrome c [Pseudomonadota bacterium]
MTSRNVFPAFIVAAVVALGIGVTLWYTDAPRPAREGLVQPRFSALALAGNIAYDKNCASCHGVQGAGSDKGPPLIHDIYNPGHHNDESFFRAARRGVPRHHWNFGDMPPQPQASRQDIAEIIRYIRELQEANGIVWKKHSM